MGIFSKRCEALVNPKTGMALYGAELEKASQDPNWPRCGASVKKTAQTCSTCGAPAPGGWIRCPACGSWVGNDSRYCHHCNTPLYPDERAAVVGGIWHRTSGIFAQRFDDEEIKAVNGEIQVQAGTSAILLDAGAVKDVLEAGRHDLDSVARKINWFGNPPKRSVVLLDSGEVALPIAFDDVREKTGTLVKFYGEVIVRFTGGRAAATNFVSNVLKEKRSLSFADLVDRFDPLFRLVVEDMCSRVTFEEIVHDVNRHITLRDRITSVLEDDLKATGLDVVRVSLGEFSSPDYEKKLDELAEQERQRQLAELERRRDLNDHEKEMRRKELNLDKMKDELDAKRRDADFEVEQQAFERDLLLGKYKAEQDLRRAKAALEDEYSLDELERKDNWKRLMEKHADADLAHQREREKAERAYKEKEEEEARQKAKIQLVREEKEREEALIRRKAALDRQWELTEKLSVHAQKIELERIQAEKERRAAQWEAEKEAKLHLWESQRQEWRQEDERRERERQNELKDIAHHSKVDDIQTDAAIRKRGKIVVAVNQETVQNAETNAKVKVIDAQGDADAKVIEARGQAEVSKITHDEKLKQTKDYKEVANKEDCELKKERDQLYHSMTELEEQMARTTDQDTKQSQKLRYNTMWERINAINKELGT